MLQGILILLLSYLCGSIPFGLFIGKFNGIDIRLHGSKNIGATNVRRILGRDWGTACFILDFLKGMLPVIWFGAMIDNGWGELLAVIGSICGHIFPIWLHFRGGKGVSTSLGSIMAVSFWTVILAAIIWYVCFRRTKIVAIASMIAAVMMPIISTILYFVRPGTIEKPAILLMSIIAILIVWRHKENIQRMLAGKENSFKK